jgi:YVTN family beta-propeller protein
MKTLLLLAVLQQIALDEIGPFGAKVTPDGNRLLVPMFGQFSPNFYPGRTVKVLDTFSDTVIATIAVGMQPEDVDYTPDGRFAFVTNSGSSSVSVIDVYAQTVVATTRVGTPWRTFLFGVSVSPDGSRAMVNSADGDYDRSDRNIFVLDADPASPTFTKVIDSITISGVFSRGAFRAGSGLFVDPRGAADNDYTAHPRLSQFAGTSLVAEAVFVPAPGGAHGVEDVALTPNGRYAYAPVFDFDPAGGSDEVFVVDLETSALVDIIRLGTPDVAQHGAGISPDGLLVVITNFNEGTVSLIFTPTNTVVRTVAVGRQPNEVAFMPGGHRFYVTNQGSGTLSAVDVLTGAALVISLAGGASHPTGPDGSGGSSQQQITQSWIDATLSDPSRLPDFISYLIDASRRGVLSIGSPKDLNPPSADLNGIQVSPGGLDAGSN